MKHTVTGQSDRPHRSPAAACVPSRSSTAASVAFTNNRPEAIAQRRLTDAIHHSPYMVAQRQQLHGMFGEAAQLQGGPEEEELLQGQFDSIQRKAPEEEELLQGKFATVQRKSPEVAELLQGKFAPVQRQGEPGEEELLQGKFAPVSSMQMKDATDKPNASTQLSTGNTGLPDQLKAGIELLSGMSLDHVRVHYNSAQPAQLNALAYTQATDIHVAQGQEQHLPHEAWHVVQQAQGRVKPTMQMKDGVPVNDDAGLEHEADVRGEKAVQMHRPDSSAAWINARAAVVPMLDPGQTRDHNLQDPLQAYSLIPSPPIPRCPGTMQLRVNATSFVGFLRDQEDLQTTARDRPDELDRMYTTVGFEHEFAQMTDGPLVGLTHLVIAKSREHMSLTDLPFVLETDAADALELVSPPFLVETLRFRPIPHPEDIAAINQLITTTLVALTAPRPSIEEFTNAMASNGVTFPLGNVAVSWENLSDESEPTGRRSRAKTRDSIAGAHLKPSEKAGPGAVSAQANFATDAVTFDLMQQTVEVANPPLNYRNSYVGGLDFLQRKLRRKLQDAATRHSRSVDPGSNLQTFLNLTARTLAGLMSVYSIEAQRKAKKRAFKRAENVQLPDEARGRASAVKDVHDVWIKDSIMSIGFGLLTSSDWGIVRAIVSDHELASALADVNELPAVFQSNQYEADRRRYLQLVPKAFDRIRKQIKSVRLDQRGERHEQPVLGISEQPEFLSHDRKLIGARQDTYLPADKVQLPGLWRDRRLHVVETRHKLEDDLNALARVRSRFGGVPDQQRPDVTVEENLQALAERFEVGTAVRFPYEQADLNDPLVFVGIVEQVRNVQKDLGDGEGLRDVPHLQVKVTAMLETRRNRLVGAGEFVKYGATDGPQAPDAIGHNYDLLERDILL